jgi:2,3-bisphosphoglycerate-independent phosphoglycerate mutase
MSQKPLALIILDGWGIAPAGEGNAIAKAKLPFFSGLTQKYPTTALYSSGREVGLSWGEVGNSEVGHLNIGSGLVCYQTLPRINKAIEDGSFFENRAFLDAIAHVKKNGSKLHFMGLASQGGVHSHIDHLFALIEFAKKNKIKDAGFHLFLDGRDAVYNSGLESIKTLEEKLKKSKVGKIASLCGRFYAMDRDNRWDRVEAAYRAMTEGIGVEAKDAVSAIEESYEKKVYDEEFLPTVIKDKKGAITIQKNDAVIFFNFRPDRAREITKAFILPQFQGFARNQIENLFFVAMTEYEKNLPVAVVFPPTGIALPLARIVSESGLTQLHIAETEKYAHITFFMNGMAEEPFKGEDRIIVPSPGVASYDQKPEMSADELTRRVVKELGMGKHNFTAINFANPDIVGHTGSLDATVRAVEVVDACLKQVIETILMKDGMAIITADHGNAEELINLQTGEMDKEHSTNPVPFIMVRNDLQGQQLFPEIPNGDLSLIQPTGILADIAPTVLKNLGISQPSDMTGNPLI